MILLTLFNIKRGNFPKPYCTFALIEAIQAGNIYINLIYTQNKILAICLDSYGVDRFMLGETGLGVAKLLTCGGCGIWALIDWFTAQKRAREYNLNMLRKL